MEPSPYEAIREGVLNHLAHHRGQLTVSFDATVKLSPPSMTLQPTKGKFENTLASRIAAL